MKFYIIGYRNDICGALYITYASGTKWASRSEWLVPGTYEEEK